MLFRIPLSKGDKNKDLVLRGKMIVLDRINFDRHGGRRRGHGDHLGKYV
jgi:hypothetical protein